MNTYAEKKKSPMLTKKQQSPQKSSDEMLRSGLSSLHSRPAALFRGTREQDTRALRDKSGFREGLPRRRIKRTRAEGVRKGCGDTPFRRCKHLRRGMVSGSYFTKRRTSRSREAAASPGAVNDDPCA